MTKSRTVIGAITVTLLAITTPAKAQETPFMSGVMMAECSAITAAVTADSSPSNDPFAMAAINWATGYMTHLNVSLMAEGQPMYELSSKSAGELWRSIYRYCEQNPQQLGIQAVSSITSAMPRKSK